MYVRCINLINDESAGDNELTHMYVVCMINHRIHYCLRKSLALFKNGQADILICTDVAARGIDVAGIPYVVGSCKCASLYMSIYVS